MDATMSDGGVLRPLDEPPAGRLTIQYAPADETEIVENPPRFTWIPDIEDGVSYAVSISGHDGFERIYPDIPVNFFTPPEVLPEGVFSWSYCVWAYERPASTWSGGRNFRISGDLPETPLTARESRFDRVPETHPRLWLDSPRVVAFREALDADPDHCGWTAFMQRSVYPWADRKPNAGACALS